MYKWLLTDEELDAITSKWLLYGPEMPSISELREVARAQLLKVIKVLEAFHDGLDIFISDEDYEALR